MGFRNLTLKSKVAILGIVIFLPTMAIGTAYFFSEVRAYVAQVAVGGLMNFVDAKQQGVIRFLGQNEKLAKQIADLARVGQDEATRVFIKSVIQHDRFDVENHQFAKEIHTGKRKIATLNVYHAIDIVRNGMVAISSNPVREGKPARLIPDTTHGYSNPFAFNDKPTIAFVAGAKDSQVRIYADAGMLTLITNGEIGNLEGDMGAFYLAGVGDTFDYYMTNQDNLLITDSRVFKGAMLSRHGSRFPWRATREKADIRCNKQGTYTTNLGVTTGCREAMGRYPGPSGENMIGASMPFYDSGWTIVVEQQEQELMAPLMDLIIKIGIIGALLSIVAYTAFLMIVNFYIFRPLRNVMGRFNN